MVPLSSWRFPPRCVGIIAESEANAAHLAVSRPARVALIMQGFQLF